MYAQRVGRKHHYSERLVQEDACGTIAFEVQGEAVYGVYVADGHGVSYVPSASLSSAERFQQFLVAELGGVVRTLLDEAGDVRSRTSVAESLERLNSRLDNVLKEKDEHLSKENGSTLALVLVVADTLYACNIGDSQILCFDRDADVPAPLKIWRLERLAAIADSKQRKKAQDADAGNSSSKSSSEGTPRRSNRNSAVNTPSTKDSSSSSSSAETPSSSASTMAESTNTTASEFSSLSSDDDPDTHTCCYPDSLFLQEGTIQRYITHESNLLRNQATAVRGGAVFGGYIHSAKSKYRLGMTCTLGNTSHKDNLFVRTNVYSFGLTELLARTVKGRVLVVLTSDGIKDLVKSNFIGQAFQNLPQTIRAMSSAIGGSMNNSPRRSILNCMNDLIPRPTDDAHDRCAKEYLEKLVALCNTASPTTADSNSIDSPSEYTDNLIAVEALCDIAILKGSTDDISVAALEITNVPPPQKPPSAATPLDQQPYDVFWNTETQKWSLVPPRHHDLELVLPQRNHPKPPPMIQKLLAAVAAAGNRKSPVALQPITQSEPLPALQPLQFGETSTVSIGWGVAAASAIETSALASFERVSAEYSIDSDEMCITPVAVGASNMELSTPLVLEATGSNLGTPTRKRKGSESLDKLNEKGKPLE